jgi:hypothetical protein
MKTKDLTIEQLAAYFAEHIRYEMQQLINATDAITRQFPIHNGLQYMILESFAIHLRNLISFLYPFSKQENDVCAEDFYKNFNTWHKLRPTISSTLEHTKIRADKEVGHLTTLRQFGTPESKKWDVTLLIDEVMPILKLFCETSDKVRLSSDFDPIWKQYEYSKTLRPTQ